MSHVGDSFHGTRRSTSNRLWTRSCDVNFATSTHSVKPTGHRIVDDLSGECGGGGGEEGERVKRCRGQIGKNFYGGEGEQEEQEEKNA